MMIPYDTSGGPPPGNPGGPQAMQRMPQGHSMPPGHHPQQGPPPPMNHPHAPPHYGHRPSNNMQYGMPPQSPAGPRQGSFSVQHAPPVNAPPQYSSHPPLHTSHHGPPGGPSAMHMSHGPPPPHPGQPPPQPIHRSNSLGRTQPLPPHAPPMPTHHDAMRVSSNSRQSQQQQYSNGPSNMGNSMNSNVGSNGMSGGWQSEQDTQSRREMIQNMRDRNGSPESMARLPQMAKQLEVSLYRNAQSFEAYMDKSSLKQRLQQIAVEVSRRARAQDTNPRDERNTSSSYSNRPQSFNSGNQQQPNSNSNNNNSMRMDIPQAPPPQPMPQQPAPSGGNSPFMGGMSTNSSSNHMVNMDDINPMANGMPMQDNSSQGYGGSRPSMSDPMQPRTSTTTNSGSMNGSLNDPMTAQGNRGSSQSNGSSDWQLRIRHKQQRLMMLHHSAKCTAKEGQCTETPHCADMKRLWRHMDKCKDNNCSVPHCFSSRAILSHYRRCKDPNCPACGPVRATVRKSSRSSTSSNNNPMMGDMRGLSSSTSPTPTPMDQSRHSLSSTSPYPASTSTGGGSSYSPARPSTHQAMPPPPGQSSLPSSSFSSQQPSHYNAGRNSRPGSSTGASQQPSQPAPFDRQKPRDSTASVNSATSSSRAFDSKSSSSRTSAPRNDTEWQKIRHKQQRLLLLRHASRCDLPPGTCKVTQHCASMKTLWAHIANCKSQQCTVQHCLSSRYVLSHYRRCKDDRCPACGPVRQAIKKGHDHTGRSSIDGQLPVEKDQLMSVDFSAPPPSSSTPPPTQSSPEELFQPEAKKAKLDLTPSMPHTTISAPPFAVESAPHLPIADNAKSELESIPDVKSSEDDVAKDAKQTADCSLLESFTLRQLETHLGSLERKTQLPPAKLKAKCLEVLKGLMTHQHGWVFNSPVDPVELGLPDYFEIIKKPMDLGTIQKKLENGAYHAIQDFEGDVHLTFDNAAAYNEKESVVHDMAKQLKHKFEIDSKKLLAQLEAEDQERRKNDRACVLCGCEKLLFEPPVYFCNGMNCQSQRIRRNSHFYVGGNNQYFWCSSCFNELDDKVPIELMDMTITKGDLKKKKNDEMHEESWVQCDTCERWVHQICGLFNTRQNKEHHSKYCCPKCLYDKRKAADIPMTKPPGAADLPRTTLSEWLEKHVTKKVEIRKQQIAEEKAQNENIPLEEALSHVNAGGPIFIRQVTAMDRKLEVRELMQKRYAHKNYPEEFPFRCKCFVVFQHLDGVDVVLFALYVYEHGKDNPPPNQRCVYISYLDSVHFMRPRRIRTFVYHEILIAYLDYARRRGFATAHIWACPPLKGDDYIFYAKPEDQKTPRDSRLRLWYIDMLIECQKRSIVGKLTNMYDLYFADPKLDATAVPYLEGDYFPGEAENIIKMIEDGNGKKSGGAGKKKKSKSNTQKSKGSTGTRSTGVDEEALIASGMFEGARSFKDLDRDQVMVKLGETIQPMKDSFIVAFLNWSGAKEEDLVVPESIEKARIRYADSKKDESDLLGSKRDAMGNMRDMCPVDQDGQPVKVIDDDAEDLDCEFLNNRQAFLNLCRGNHYQFDELRRAKHTSMMVLWHLHNRDAPKFVQQCFACNREILSGKRFHCNTCQEYDLCEECYKNPDTNRGSCTHTLQPIAVDPEASKERSGISEQERKQRQRNLMLHIQLIEHASRCGSAKCTSTNCAKMKQYLQHARVCRVKVQGGCKICKRIWTLLRIHAQKCKDPACPIPQCNAIREKMRQLQKQQQAMDDRRRLEMNRHMRFSVTGGG